MNLATIPSEVDGHIPVPVGGAQRDLHAHLSTIYTRKHERKVHDSL